MTRAVIGRTVGALLCVALFVALWVTALRALLAYAQSDPGAYIIAAFVFMLLPFGTLCVVGLLLHDRAQSKHKPERPALPSVPPQRELPRSYSPPRIYTAHAALAPNQAYALIERHGDAISIRPVS